MAKTWKNLERKVAKKLGGRRISRAHDWGASLPDVDHELFSIECKSGRQVPKFFYDALSQSAGYSKDKVPLVVAHRHYERDSVVCMYFKDFLEFFGHEHIVTDSEV